MSWLYAEGRRVTDEDVLNCRKSARKARMQNQLSLTKEGKNNQNTFVFKILWKRRRNEVYQLLLLLSENGKMLKDKKENVELLNSSSCLFF